MQKPDINKAIKNVGAEEIAPVVHGVYQLESSSGKADTSKPNYAGARGPMQVKKSTFQQMKDEGYIPQNYKWDNPQHSMEGGVAYLKYIRDHFDSMNHRILGAGFYGGPGAVKDPAKGVIADERGDPKNPKASKVGEYADKLEAYLKKNAPDYLSKYSIKPSAPPPPAPVPLTPAPTKKHWWEMNPDVFPVPLTSTDAVPQDADQDITMPADYSPGGRQKLI